MVRLLTCPQGHSFDFPNGERTSTAAYAVCPVCGTPCAPPGDEATILEAPRAPAPSQAVTAARSQDIPFVPAIAGPSPVSLPTVPGYEFLAKLGQGGMGVVYKVRQIKLNRLVALKMILGGVDATPQQLARFQLEAEALASLHHPHIIQVHDVGICNGKPYFTMEFVDGSSLDQKLAGRPQPPHEAARLVELLARAMHAAHQRGIIHRDLKPDNVLLAADGSPKIVDFGLAKRLHEDDDRTLAGTILGTPNYMAPEQAQGNSRDVGPATDVHALGVILFELLTGKAPFHGPTAMTTLHNVRTADPLPPSKLQAGVPHDLDVVCLKCLQKQPGQRYNTGEALAEDLRRFLAHEPILARPASVGERCLKWVRRHPTVAMLLAVLLVGTAAALTAGLWYNIRLRDERDRAEKNLHLALRAVDEMLTEVGEEQLANEPHMTGKQRALLERALELYQRLCQDQQDEPFMRRHLGLGWKRVGDIHRLLGQYDKGEEAYAQAIALLKTLAAEFPEQAQFRQYLAQSWNFRGELFRLGSQRARAEEAYRQALQLQKELVQSHPDRPEFRKDLAMTHYNLGLVLKDSGQNAEAQQHLQSAIALLERLHAVDPDRPEYRQHLGRAWLNLGTVLHSTEGFEPVRMALAKAIALLRELSDRLPEVREYRYELAVALNNQGNLHNHRGNYADAEQYHRESMKLLERLVADFPSIPLYRMDLANTHNSLGWVLVAIGDYKQAKGVWLAGEEYLKKLVAGFPNVPAYRGDLGMTRCSLGWVLRKQKDATAARQSLRGGLDDLDVQLRSNPNHPEYLRARRFALETLGEVEADLGDHAAAAKAVVLSTNMAATDSRGYFRAAVVLARWSALAREDGILSEPERHNLALTYADQAMRLLHLAVDQGFSDLASMQSEAAFALLRDREDFAALVQRLAKKGA